MMNEQNQNNQPTNDIQRALEEQLLQFGTAVTQSVAQNVSRAAEKISENRWSFAQKQKASKALEKAASARSGIGIMQSIFGAFLGISLILSGVICLASSVALPVGAILLQITGGSLAVAGLPFVYMLWLGQNNLKLSKRMKRYVADIDKKTSISVDELALTTCYDEDLIYKDIRKMMDKDWCPLWFTENTRTLYLTIEEYRKAKEQDNLTIAAMQAEQAAKAKRENESVLLQNITNFIDVLGKQAQIMEDAAAVEELKRTQETCRDIYDWLKIHPESEPRMRRFTSYYMPTTLNLLHSYNEVQDQQGENAQTIRRDISRFLHTLNTAFDNLHDSLLSSVSLDVSSEIAALQGMLAQDGLSANDDFSSINLQS